jgi:PIN domain nuclease of toxin-antitoxin system
LNLLLDTNILLWWLWDSPRLPKSARELVAKRAVAYVSAATAWEISIKVSVRKLRFDGDLEQQLASNNFLSLPVTISHAVAAAKLPLLHTDPFDRMLIAQASVESLTLLTADARLREYNAPVVLV